MTRPSVRRLKKRRVLLPPAGSGSRAGRNTPHILSRRPVRCISFASRVRGYYRDVAKIADGLRPDPIARWNGRNQQSQMDGYDSDEEDLRNGVRITYSAEGRVVFKASLRYVLESEFHSVRARGEQLSAMLSELEPEHRRLRRHYSETLGLDWTTSQWEHFFLFEDRYFKVRERLYDVQDEMEHMTAQMYLFLVDPYDYGYLIEDGDTTVWSLNGIAEEQVRNNEYPALEWNGVDLNESIWDYEKLSSAL
ncbi:hypothetical protein SAMD00023353_0702750 [Rosellinia necatrix]|uniref:Uncharacterized protein n=1 Tax=Rosellinia necatrix TaxID=77044 RepID=A0A1S8A5W5_ROSNE|nr:hypothetical protein SAMD00023353_0702750 [Rosellinia necatrix]